MISWLQIPYSQEPGEIAAADFPIPVAFRKADDATAHDFTQRAPGFEPQVGAWFIAGAEAQDELSGVVSSSVPSAILSSIDTSGRQRQGRVGALNVVVILLISQFPPGLMLVVYAAVHLLAIGVEPASGFLQ